MRAIRGRRMEFISLVIGVSWDWIVEDTLVIAVSHF